MAAYVIKGESNPMGNYSISRDQGIGIDTPEFRAQLSTHEYVMFRAALSEFLRAHDLHVFIEQQCEAVWYYGDHPTIGRIRDWDLGYCMALGFDEEGVRHK